MLTNSREGRYRKRRSNRSSRSKRLEPLERLRSRLTRLGFLRKNINHYLRPAPKNGDRYGYSDLLVCQKTVQIIDPGDRLLAVSNDNVTFPQVSSFGRAVGLSGYAHDAGING